MGNNNPRTVRFRQSIQDFPLTVALGEKCPSWALSRWRGNRGLKFLPPDDEGFSLRGDKRQIVYRGRRRSLRFVILGDNAFEYDVLLLREPESNVITLRMDGAESFDFFRQPDFVTDPFLKGSYAVYKKDTFIGEGTGKLCHIHRPEIIDARGRRCWGELSVVENELRITIPEKWLGEAKYPIIVDPEIGTTTKGSLTGYNLTTDTAATAQLSILRQITVNRYYTDMQISGTCTGYAWANATGVSYTSAGYPLIYSDVSGVPKNKLSSNEQLMSLNLLPGNNSGFRSSGFSVGNINANTYLYYGISSDQVWYPRFDMGDTLYVQSWSGTPTPATFPANALLRSLRMSMYFTFTANYTRTLTQGVKLSDSRKGKTEYKRSALQTAGVTALFERINILSRKCLETVATTMTIGRLNALCRNIQEQVSLSLEKWAIQQLHRIFAENVTGESGMAKKQSLIRKVEDVISGMDNQEFSVMFYRSITDTTIVTQANSGIRGFIREVKSTAGNFDSMEHGAGFYRYPIDTVDVESSLLRKLDVFVRIAIQVIAHEFFLGRFLKSKTEIVLKSCITRELTIESKIN
jgi:hypothetical protein